MKKEFKVGSNFNRYIGLALSKVQNTWEHTSHDYFLKRDPSNPPRGITPHIAQKDQYQNDLLKLSPTEGSENKESSSPPRWEGNGYRKYAKQHRNFLTNKQTNKIKHRRTCCEMKIPHAILRNKKCHTINNFWPPNMNEGSPNCDPANAGTASR